MDMFSVPSGSRVRLQIIQFWAILREVCVFKFIRIPVDGASDEDDYTSNSHYFTHTFIFVSLG